MRTRSLVAGLGPSALLFAIACSGGGSTRSVAVDAGVDGSAGHGSGNGGSSAGGGGGTPNGGAGGGGGSGGLGGAGGSAGDAGAVGGTGGLLPDGGFSGDVFFTVAPGALGLSGSGVAELGHPESRVYVSNGSGASHVSGQNITALTAAQLGLLVDDDLADIAVLKPVAAHPLYHFSVSGKPSVGYDHTDVNRSSLEAEVPADVFVSDGVGEHFDGESGRRPGWNALTIDEARLGLSATPASGADASPGAGDDVHGLEVGVTGVPTEFYFTVAKSAVGATGSAVAGTAADERGCTVFKTTLNGTNTKAYSCANLGLAPGDQIDAVDIGGAGSPSQILFSVSAASVGASSTAVSTEAVGGEVSGDIFRSTGAGTNELLVDEAGLGLNREDELDALAVTDDEIKPAYAYDAGSCIHLSPNPEYDATTAGAFYVLGRAWVSNGIFLLLRQRQSASEQQLVAYDVATCSQIGNAVTVQVNGDAAGPLVYPAAPLAAVPLPGWSKASPFANLEIWGADLSTTARLFRLTPAGVLAQIVSLDAGVGTPVSIVYRSMTNDFALVYQTSGGKRAVFVARPGANATTAPATSTFPVPFPCEEYAGFIGVDPVSNGLELWPGSNGGKKICSLDGELHFRKVATWIGAAPPDSGAAPVTDTIYDGFIVPGTGLYGFSTITGNYDLASFKPLP